MTLTSAGFLGLEAGVPGLLPYLLEEKEVEGPACGKIKFYFAKIPRH